MSRKYIYPLLIILVTVGLWYAEQYIDRQQEHYPEESKTTELSEEFGNAYIPTSTTGEVIRHNYYTLSYSEAHEQAEWVAYELNKEHLKNNDFERPYFIQDRKVSSGSADWRSYKNSGYDRGHLVAAADREFEYNAFHETFLTSNISPQNHDFNSGIWNRLEQKVRYWAEKYDGVFVVSGGVLQPGLKTIGSERVSVPEKFYKIVVDASTQPPKAIAFLIPNKPSSRSYFEYVVTIDSLETITGIDFFPGLETSVQNMLEGTIDKRAWTKR
ncbi:DNA/RNA non-specific endonuclease [Flavobacteriaceae bacterium TK19130]|nr:DNA/RNA non-specific endonuclease [Thermobacterium salinum]